MAFGLTSAKEMVIEAGLNQVVKLQVASARRRKQNNRYLGPMVEAAKLVPVEMGSALAKFEEIQLGPAEPGLGLTENRVRSYYQKGY